MFCGESPAECYKFATASGVSQCSCGIEREFNPLNYGVTFILTEKIDVNGADAHPLFKYLTTHAPGILGTEAIKWNFTKFLLDREGRIVHRYAPTTVPEKLTGDIEKLLG